MSVIPHKMSKSQIEQDKGFAWIILVVAFIVNVIEASVFMSPAVYMVAWDTSFEVTKAQLGTAGSLLNGMAVMSGIAVGPIITKYGCRPPTLIGTLVCAVGFVASVFATSMEWLYITYGCISGIGLGLFGLPPIICVQYYFNKKRPFALGTSLAGHSVGALTSVSILQYLIEIYGWRSTMLLHTGVILQVLVLGSFFRPVNITTEHTSDADSSEEKKNISTNAEHTTQLSSEHDCSVHIGKNIPLDAEEHVGVTICQERQHFKTPTVQNYSFENITKSNESETKLRDDEIKLDESNQIRKVTTNSEGNHNEAKHSKKTCFNCLKKLLSYWNFSLLKDKAFLMYVINMTIIEFGCGTYYKFTPIRVIHDGLSKQNAAFIYSLIGIPSLTMRIVISVIANLPKVNRSVLSGFAVLGMGVVCCVSCAAYDFTTYAICSLLFGACLGTFASSVFTIMTDIVGITNVAQAFSLLNAFASIAVFTNLPLAGFIIDVSGSYDLVFYIYGASMCVPGILFLTMTCIFPHLKLKNSVSTKNENQLENNVPSSKNLPMGNSVNHNVCLSTASLNKAM